MSFFGEFETLGWAGMLGALWAQAPSKVGRVREVMSPLITGGEAAIAPQVRRNRRAALFILLRMRW